MRSTSVPVDPAVRRRRRVENLQREFDDVTAQLTEARERLEDIPRGRAHAGDRDRQRVIVAQLRSQQESTRRALSRARVKLGPAS